MRYSIESRDRIYVKGYGFLSFTKNMGKILSNKYGQKLLDSAEKSTTDVIKTASKRAIQKTAEATADLIGNKIADKITRVSKKPSNNNSNNNNNNNNEDVELMTHKKIYITYNKQIRFKTAMLRSSLCDYSDAYILVKGNISVNNAAADGASANNTNKKVIFKNFAPFTNCINKINNTQINNVEYIDTVMPMYNLIESRENYSKTSGLWQIL